MQIKHAMETGPLNRMHRAVPEELCDEWMRHLKINSPGGTCVIDLCAGYQSLKPFALAHGYNYIAVDLLGDRNAKPSSGKKGGCQC